MIDIKLDELLAALNPSEADIVEALGAKPISLTVPSLAKAPKVTDAAEPPSSGQQGLAPKP